MTEALVKIEREPIQPIPNRWPYRRKFKRGGTIHTMSALLYELQHGKWVYLHGTPKHPSILKNMSLSTLEGMVRAGVLYYAIRQEEPCQTEKTSS